MTQAYNLSQLANNLNTAGQLDATDGLVNAVPIANGGTGATTDVAARAALNVPTRTGGDASGTWNIAINNGVYTVGDQTIGGTKTFTNGIRFNDGSIQTSTAVTGPKLQLFTTSGTFNVPAGITTLVVSVYAGGGGGSDGIGYPGNPGGAGAAMVAYLSGLTPGAGIAVTVGSGGNGSSPGGLASGSPGGASSFGGFVTCTGGGGAPPASPTVTPGATGTATTSGTRLAMRSGGVLSVVNNFAIATRASDNGSNGTTNACIDYGGGGGGGGGHGGGGGGGARTTGLGGAAGNVYGSGSNGQNGVAGASIGGIGGNGGGLNGGVGGAANFFGGGGGGGGGGFVLVQW
jgi:hypothetical protein